MTFRRRVTHRLIATMNGSYPGQRKLRIWLPAVAKATARANLRDVIEP